MQRSKSAYVLLAAAALAATCVVMYLDGHGHVEVPHELPIGLGNRAIATPSQDGMGVETGVVALEDLPERKRQAIDSFDAHPLKATSPPGSWAVKLLSSIGTPLKSLSVDVMEPGGGESSRRMFTAKSDYQGMLHIQRRFIENLKEVGFRPLGNSGLPRDVVHTSTDESPAVVVFECSELNILATLPGGQPAPYAEIACRFEPQSVHGEVRNVFLVADPNGLTRVFYQDASSLHVDALCPTLNALREGAMFALPNTPGEFFIEVPLALTSEPTGGVKVFASPGGAAVPSTPFAVSVRNADNELVIRRAHSEVGAESITLSGLEAGRYTVQLEDRMLQPMSAYDATAAPRLDVSVSAGVISAATVEYVPRRTVALSVKEHPTEPLAVFWRYSDGRESKVAALTEYRSSGGYSTEKYISRTGVYFAPILGEEPAGLIVRLKDSDTVIRDAFIIGTSATYVTIKLD